MKKSKNSKESLNKKLKSYTTIALSAIAADATSQVIYTDIKDTTLINNGDFFDIDLNNDGITDVKISLDKFSSSYSSSGYYFKYNSNSIEASGPNYAYINASLNSSYSVLEAAALNNNTSINNNLNTWNTYAYVGRSFSSIYRGPSYTSSSGYSIGQFAANGDKYLGVKFNIGINTHYGWIRLDMAANYDITIKDFAYDTTASTAILAGDTGISVGINEVNKNNAEFYSQNNRIIFKSRNHPTSEIKIYDLKGQLIERRRLLANQKELLLKKEYQGIYIVEVNEGESVFRKKLWLESK